MTAKSDLSLLEVPVDPQRISSFQDALTKWFGDEGKSYPWRETVDPYAILVSELMLQQTRIQTVLEKRYFERWMEKFPDMESLALAKEEEVLKAWEGLGYYNRARNLQKTAAVITKTYGGTFPEDYSQILTLPGVGPYTAGAVYSFAFGKRAPIVDGNIIRVLTRLFSYPGAVDTSEGIKQLWFWAEKMTPQENVRIYNSAIMELGQSICSRSAPRCNECPVLEWCQSGNLGEAEQYPVKAKSTKITRKQEHVVVIRKGSRVFLVKEEGTRRKGLWRLPEVDEAQASGLKVLFTSIYFITRYKVNLVVHSANDFKTSHLSEQTRENGRWFDIFPTLEDLPPLGAPYRKALIELGKMSKNHNKKDSDK